MRHRRNRLSAFHPAAPGLAVAGAHGHRRPLIFFTPLPTPEETPYALARCLLNLVGTGAGSDLLPVDEAPGPANDAGTARIIVRPDGYVVGMGGNEGSSGWNEGSPRGNDVYPAGNVVGVRTTLPSSNQPTA